ncbi:ABC transporter ATP-binding protein [Otariodibacter sp.]|uniref:ABC transporter ATP-binding protein n=1 Tax=Otariodibacter sp. TaxID=3030919 RepID=UPI0026172EEF|nr:ABC transporter ATP-binding protein [Otariodibacter sp.]
MHSVKINNLTLAFGEQVLFKDFSFSLKKGQWTTLLGSSGVGKSTLLRAIAGLENEAIQQGQIDLSHQSKIAWLAQEDALYPWLSILDNVQLEAHLSRCKNKQTTEKAKALLEQVKMIEHIYKAPYQLSGGQKQRVALARTLMQEADIILMDEPFSALDAVTRYQLQNLSYSLLKDKTILLITHDPQEAIRLSHNIAILKGTPATITHQITLLDDLPRELNQESLWQLQKELLDELASGELI